MAKAAKTPKKKASNTYEMPETLPVGEIVKDMNGKEWKLGPAIGKGGFGEIYSAQANGKASTKYPYVVKIEPHQNGPLFVEMHFYMRNAKTQDVEKFTTEHKLKTLGMPVFIGFGSHNFNRQRYRFIVIEKYGSDIDKLLKEQGGAFPRSFTFQLAWQMSYVLQYIHECGYVHADLKGANILLGTTPETKEQAYLLDFGLACTYQMNDKFTPNPKRAHDGTPEYLSRDAHLGVYTPRGDLEILAYNMVVWLGGKLPWINDVKYMETVQKKKEEAFGNLKQFLQTSLGGKTAPAALKKLLEYTKKLKFNDKIDYNYIRTLFEAEIESTGASIHSLDIKQKLKRKSSTPSVVVSPLKRKRTNLRSARTSSPPNNDSVPVPEDVGDGKRANGKKVTMNAEKGKKSVVKNTEKKTNGEKDNVDTSGFTPAMLEVLRKKQAKLKTRGASDSSTKENITQNKSGRTKAL